MSAPRGRKVNRQQKSGKDAGEWVPDRNLCRFAGRVLKVKRAYGLTVDRREAAALETILTGNRESVKAGRSSTISRPKAGWSPQRYAAAPDDPLPPRLRTAAHRCTLGTTAPLVDRSETTGPRSHGRRTRRWLVPTKGTPSAMSQTPPVGTTPPCPRSYRRTFALPQSSGSASKSPTSAATSPQTSSSSNSPWKPSIGVNGHEPSTRSASSVPRCLPRTPLPGTWPLLGAATSSSRSAAAFPRSYPTFPTIVQVRVNHYKTRRTTNRSHESSSPRRRQHRTAPERQTACATALVPSLDSLLPASALSRHANTAPRKDRNVTTGATPTDSGDPISALRQVLLQIPPRTLERLAGALLGRLLDVPVRFARSGDQRGGDAGVSGAGARHLILEARRYGDTSNLDERGILGEIEQAVERQPDLEAWLLVTTREVPEQVQTAMVRAGLKNGIGTIIIDWQPQPLPKLAALAARYPECFAAEVGPDHAGLLAAIVAMPSHSSTFRTITSELQSWAIGYQAVRHASHTWLREIWQSARLAGSRFQQNVAGGSADAHHVRRCDLIDGLDAWSHLSTEGRLGALVGPDGMPRGRWSSGSAPHWLRRGPCCWSTTTRARRCGRYARLQSTLRTATNAKYGRIT